MTDTTALRTAIVGLLRSAVMEEELLLVATSRREDAGSAECWAALPTIAHNTMFKRQQVIRLQAVLAHEVPPNFVEIEHQSEQVYREYAAGSAETVAEESRRAVDDLVDALLSISDEDLMEPARHPWLRGRGLWLQTIVRGFWHPMGHTGDWYVAHEMQEHGVALRRHAVATAQYLNAPNPSQGMAWFSLACTCATVGTTDAAIEALGHASELNSDLRERIATEPDLAPLRNDRRVAALIG